MMRRSEVLAHRIRAQQLDRPAADREVTDAAIFDLGVQDSGRDGASWALANRGVPVAGPAELEASPAVALAWTLRSAPHYYRRPELEQVAVATSPLSEADATKRVVGAGRPLKAAGLSTVAGLTEVASRLRAIVDAPLPKGEASGRLSRDLPPPYLRDCRACGVVHTFEVPFRIGALYAGLELQPGTSPPVLRRTPGWTRPPGPAPDPLAAPSHLQPIRGYLRLLGPASPQDVAAFLDAPVGVIKAHWPADAQEVTVEGRPAWLLDPAEEGDVDADLVRLLGPFDLFLQARDRDLLVPDTSRQASLWPVLGRPGAILAGLEIVGSWRPRTAGSAFTLRLDLWRPVSAGLRARIEGEAERLAAHRGLRLAAVETA